MSRAVNAVVIGIAVFILVAGSFWYLSVSNGNEKLSVDSHLSLQSADDNRTRILADLTFNNRHDVDVELTEFTYEFRAGSLTLAKNQTSGELAMKPRTEHDESIVLEFPTDFVSEWLKQHVQAGEKTTIVFEGNATFRVGSRNQTVEFGEEHPFTTDVRSSLEKAENCPRPSPQPCVESLRATWRERNETLVLDLSLRVKNGVEQEVKISHPEATLWWGETEVAGGEAGGVVLAGGASRPLEFELFLQHEKLKAWWPGHLESCERSPVALDVSFTYQVQPEDRTTTPSPTVISTPPTFTPPTSTSTSTTPPPPPTTSTPPTTSASPSPSPSPSPTTSSPSPSASPTSTTNSSSAATNLAAARVSYLFLVAPEEPENQTASWKLEGSEFHSTFVCDDPGELADLP